MMSWHASPESLCASHDQSAVGARHAGEFAERQRTRSHGELLQRFHGNLRGAFLGLLGLVSAPVAAAAESGTGAPSLQAPIGSGDILSVGASLVVVVAAIMLCGWLYSRSQGLRIRGGGIISIIATQPLGPKERILLIEVADKQLIVGMTSTQVSTLHVFDEPVVRQEAGVEQRGNFSDRLKGILRGSGT